MKVFPAHPGKILITDMHTKLTHEADASQSSDRAKFVYLDSNGVEVDSPEEAAERVPVVEVQMIPTDGRGVSVSREEAKQIRVLEFGPSHRPLRSTAMVKG